MPSRRPLGWMTVALVLAAAPSVAAEPDGGVDPALDVRLEALLGADPKALALARALATSAGDVVEVLPEEDMEGGYRGAIHLVPAPPVGPLRVHLERVAGALGELAALYGAVQGRAERPLSYRWTRLTLRFFRSVKKRTPAAFASGWRVAYNVNGTLNGSQPAVRDLLTHELFHLNDADHQDWSARALGSLYDGLVARCGRRVDCLTPYVPDPLVVHGGTYYAFMPGNDVREYAADLALRYAREQREVLAGRPVPRPFKCGPAENAQAWAALVDEFFAGVDAVPPCPTR